MNDVTNNSAVSLPMAHQSPRLVLHADCTTCGRLNEEEDNPLAVVDIALGHTDGTGHVVVLNGTADLPGEDRDTSVIAGTGSAELPSIDEVLADPSASFWLRNALLAALSRDPVDAANDAELLVRLMDKRCCDVLKGSKR